LREKFGLVTKEYTEVTRVIIVEVLEKKIGMIVDNVSQVVRVEEANIMPPPPMTNEGDNDYIDGVVRLDDRLIILLKVDKLLSTEEVVQLQQVDLKGAEKQETVSV
jgi:purine-binding chemotaxis protein CheW